MEWVRGGVWVPWDDPRFSSDPQPFGWAHLLVPSGAFPRRLLEPTNAAEWWSKVGAPLGLEPYALSDDMAASVLADYASFVDRYPFKFDLWDDSPVAREALLGLCELLSRYGPFGRTYGAMPPSMALLPEFETTQFNWREVNLADFRGEMEDLVAVHRTLNEVAVHIWDPSAVTSSIVAAAGQGLRDMEVVPVVRAQGISYDARPRSLRAYLWAWSLWRLGKVPRNLCLYCGEAFRLEPGPGQPPRYCPDHRSSKYRQAVRANRAPSMQIPSDFDEEE